MRITGGFLKNRMLSTPKGVRTRPTSEKLRQTVFDICQFQLEGAHFLDIFAGSGAMGIEALSRGANHATFLEKDHFALRAIRENCARFNLTERVTILSGDAIAILKKFSKAGALFDLIYIDPPYGLTFRGGTDTYLDAALSSVDQLSLLSDRGMLFCEALAPPTAPLCHLVLEKQRRVGSTYLSQYGKSVNFLVP